MNNRMTIPVGPQHPLLKEPVSFTLELSGERVESAKVAIGYVHRGIERLVQQQTYPQAVALIERICGICSNAHTTAYCGVVEKVMGLEIPQRAAMIRVLFCELERIHSHLLWLGVLSEAIGFTTIFMYAWREREPVLEIMEELSGGRIAHAANIVGGVRSDISNAQAEAALAKLDQLAEDVTLFEQMIERDRSFHRRTRGVGVMDATFVRQRGIVGPTARASGCTVDMRKDAPYVAYEQLSFEVIVAEGGDVWSRAWVRVREIDESLSLCRQVLQKLPVGAVAVRAPRRAPEGEAVMRIEAPRGELFYYLCSDGSDKPARLKVRTPTLPMLQALGALLPGAEAADIAAIIAGADLCIACADR